MESERRPSGAGGAFERTATLFLVGAECPFTCVFCDLWRFTIDEPTPKGALPRQIEKALRRLHAAGEAPTAIKLYNASNFFDPRAVPTVDLPTIAELLRDVERVVVECHPRLIDDSVVKFSGELQPSLEVAIGLETVHPEAAREINKASDVGLYRAGTDRLNDAGVAHRAFVLLQPPFVPEGDQLDALEQTIVEALECGASHVAVIPTRGGNGAMEELQRRGLWRPPTLDDIEASLELMQRVELQRGGVIELDAWDVDALVADPERRAGLLGHPNVGDLPTRVEA